MLFLLGVFTSIIACVGADYANSVCNKLRPELLKIRLRGVPPKPDEVRQLFIEGCSDEYDEMDRDFPFAFMEEVTSMKLNFNQLIHLGYPVKSWIKYRGFEDSQLTKIRKLLAGLLKHKFSLRHYAIKKRSKIRSNYALWYDKTIVSATTTGKDWNFLGDTAFTFWWFCIDGKVPTINHRFIETSKYYDEIAIDEKSLRARGLWDVEFFASTDLMEHAEELQNILYNPILLRGKLQDLPEIVFGYFLLTNKFAELPLDKFEEDDKNTITKLLLGTVNKVFPIFEIKVPGSVGNTNWKDKSAN